MPWWRFNKKLKHLTFSDNSSINKIILWISCFFIFVHLHIWFAYIFPYIYIYIYGKWNTQAVENAQSIPKMIKVIGTVANRRAGIGLHPQHVGSKESTLNEWKLVSEEIHHFEENKCIATAIRQYKQGAWSRWKSAKNKTVTWNDIKRRDLKKLSFLIKAVYDVLPKVVKLHLWSNLHLIGLLSLFNGISTFVGYFDAKAILLEEQLWYDLTHSWEDKGVHTFPKSICPEVNVIVRLEYELAYYNSAVHRFNHYTTRTPPLHLSYASM